MFSSIRCSIFRIHSFLVRCHIKKFWFCYRVNKKSEHVIAPGLAKFYAESYKRALLYILGVEYKKVLSHAVPSRVHNNTRIHFATYSTYNFLLLFDVCARCMLSTFICFPLRKRVYVCTYV